MSSRSTTLIASSWEGRAWIASALLLIAVYAYGALSGATGLIGIGVPAGLTPASYLLLTAAALAVALLFAWIDPRRPIGAAATAVVAAVLSWPLFFLLRTNVLNPDGNALAPKFEADVPRLGAFVTHDELLEFFLHSRVWFYTHRWWGWSVVESYQVVSCLAGGCFVFGVIRLAPRIAPVRTWLFLAGVLCGGYLQLFFGDAENYTVTAAIMIGYVIAATRYLEGTAPPWVPAATLAIAMCFHLETGWALPSLLYLGLISRRRSGRWHAAAIGTAVGCAIGLTTVGYFHFHGLPIMRFFSSHAGHALRMNGVFAIGMPPRYYLQQADLLLWLCPAVALLAPIALWRRHAVDETTAFLALAAGSMMFLQVVWKAQLGVYDDWNLYAIGGMLGAIGLWQRIAAAASSATLRVSAAAIAAAAWAHTAAWILANHAGGR